MSGPGYSGPSEAYALGCDAANDYESRNANPYEIGTEDYNDWDDGWDDVHADQDKDEGGD